MSVKINIIDIGMWIIWEFTKRRNSYFNVVMSIVLRWTGNILFRIWLDVQQMHNLIEDFFAGNAKFPSHPYTEQRGRKRRDDFHIHGGPVAA